MTPEQTAALRWFASTEFDHPEIVENQAAVFLDGLREAYGASLTLTSDARTPEQNTQAGGSPTSLHLLGRAFDIRWPGNEEAAWRFLEAFFLTLGWTPPTIKRPVELEFVYGPTDHHIHFGLYPTDRASRLIVAAD